MDKAVSSLIENDWASGFPVDGEDINCIAIAKDKFQNVHCNYTGKPDFDPTNDGLAYICEAKPITSPENEGCIFPFVYLGTEYVSCAYNIIAEFNPLGKPWCATKVKVLNFALFTSVQNIFCLRF